MTWILAVELDPATLNWIIAGVGAGVVSGSGAIWIGIRKLCAFLRPYVVDWFVSHTKMAETLNDQAPVIATTLQAMSVTLDGHTETLEEHSGILQRVVKKLEKRRPLNATDDDDSNDSTRPIVQGL